MSQTTAGVSPRTKKFLITVGVIGVVGTLIYLEQIALLYVIATLALIALLLAVAFYDLESVGVDAAHEEVSDRVE